jgi:acetylornithine deacetylase
VSLSGIQQHLQALVGFDTRNPPRLIDGDSPVFDYCASAVGDGFRLRTWDHGDGHVSWLAVRGNPRVLFNVHLDTVPEGEGWNSNPLELVVADGRAYARGACDIKGAAACLLHLAQDGARNLAILFTTDEEGAGSCCVRNFVEAGEAEPFEQIIVAEPTGCRAVLGHRGFLSVKTWFRAESGHSSESRALEDNAVHQMSRWAVSTLELAESMKTSPDDPGTCLNLGLAQGGTKSNVIAGEMFLHWSARLRPGESNQGFLEQVKNCAPAGARTEWLVPFTGDPLPADGLNNSSAAEFVATNGIESTSMVDFWTEASIFSAAGKPAVVLGPGNIEQAHAANEWVALEQLELASKLYGKVIRNDG